MSMFGQEHPSTPSLARVMAMFGQEHPSTPSLLGGSGWTGWARENDRMLRATDTRYAPWYILRSDDKRRARLNCLAQILELVPYKKVPRDKVKLPKRSTKHRYDDQASLKGRTFVAERF